VLKTGTHTGQQDVANSQLFHFAKDWHAIQFPAFSGIYLDDCN